MALRILKRLLPSYSPESVALSSSVMIVRWELTTRTELWSHLIWGRGHDAVARHRSSSGSPSVIIKERGVIERVVLTEKNKHITNNNKHTNKKSNKMAPPEVFFLE